MSWWDSKNIANFATKALKSAQEHIDKALDIREDGEAGEGSSGSTFTGGLGGEDFWDSYLGSDETASASVAVKQDAPKSSSSNIVTTITSDSSASIGKTHKSKSSAHDVKGSASTSFDSFQEQFIKSSNTSNEAAQSTGKKTSSLKLSNTKLGRNKKEMQDKSTPPRDQKDAEAVNVSSGSPDIEEQIGREKEAEMYLHKLLDNNLPITAPVATLHLDDSAVNNTTVADTALDSFQNVSNTSLFDMSGSSIMQDNWGDDVSLSLLVDSTTSIGMGSSDVAVNAVTPCDMESQIEQVPVSCSDAHEYSESLDDDGVKTVTGSVNTDEQNTKLDTQTGNEYNSNNPTISSEDHAMDDHVIVPTPQADEVIKPDSEQCENDAVETTLSHGLDNVDDIVSDTGAVSTGSTSAVSASDTGAVSTSDTGAVLTSDTGAVSAGDTGTVSASDTGTVSANDTGTVSASDTGAVSANDTGAVSANDGDAALLDSLVEIEKSMSFVMNDSATSSSIDDLSSSNRTLTTEDLLSLDVSPEVVQPEVSQADSQSAPANIEGLSLGRDCDTETDSSDVIVSSSSRDNAQCVEDDEFEVCSAVSTEEKQLQTLSASIDDSSEPLTHSTSFVVTSLLEDAMAESVKDVDESHCEDSTSHSSSDMVRVESGQNSEMTSADELETATSSDIEIISHISTPTSNGDRLPFELSSLRIGNRSNRRRGSPPGHHRTDSDSSAFSVQSKNGDDFTRETRSEAYLFDHCRYGDHSPRHDNAEECRNDPYEAEKLLKKLADMAEVLEAREKKLVELSRSNMDLTETNSILRNQLEQSEETRDAEMTDLNQLTSEFTVRISEAERKLSQATKERDELKKQYGVVESLLTKRSDSSSVAQKMILEKDQQITELMEEGEKLSKQQLQSNNIIKKLRIKEKESESLIKSQKEKLDTQKTDTEHLKKVLDNKCDVEKQQAESINQLQAAVQKYDMQLDKYKTELEESLDKHRSLQAALDNSYKEITELHKANAMKASQVQEQKLSSEIQAKQQLQIQLDRQLIQAKQDQEAMLNQIEDQRLTMYRLEKEATRREDVLKQEISDLQQRLQEAEDRNQDLTQGVTAATRPLLRQIENLQSTYAAQSGSYERVEKTLTDRLSESQLSLATAQEKERVACEQLMEVSTRLRTLETQLSSLKQERSKHMAQLEMDKTKIEVLEDAKNNFTAQREALQQSYDQEIIQLKKDKLLLENQYEMEKIRVDAEKKKAVTITEQLRDKEMQIASMLTSRSSTPSSDPPNASNVTQSMSNSYFSTLGEDTMDRSFVLTPTGSKTSLYESLRHTGAASLLENLQSQLKQQDGEISQLQNEIRELERTRESMARELVNLSNSNQEQALTLEEFEDLKIRYKDQDKRYNALLQMYGEKVEEAQELRLDLSDIKDLYKTQIDELLTTKR